MSHDPESIAHGAAPQANAPLTPTTARRLEGQEGVYEITSTEPAILGRLAVFYPARDVRTGELVLVKSFRDAPDDQFAIGGFYKELRAIRQLRHPNILQVLDYNSGSGPEAPPFLVLPWCRGGNLRDLQGHADFLPLSAVISVLEQVASAIDYAHQNGVIHGDIKPENVLLSEDRRQAFVADFGMAKFFDVSDQVRRSQEAPLIRNGSSTDRGASARAGTSAYLSPEQLADNRQSPESDTYSFALIAYELLTGQLPFDISAPLYRQIHARVVGDLVDPADALPSLSESARAALRHGLATNPRNRPALSLDFCRMLTGAMPVPKARGSRMSQKERVQGWWASLPSSQRAAVITAVIAAFAGVLTAIIQIVPMLLGKAAK